MTNHYKTKSLSLAAALQVASTAKLVLIDFTNPPQAIFCFDRTQDPSFDDIVARFFARQLPVDAVSYFESLRLIKSRLYEGG